MHLNIYIVTTYVQFENDKAVYVRSSPHKCESSRRFRVMPHSKEHKVKDGALRTALSPIAICVLLPTGVEATMPPPSSALTKVKLQRSITIRSLTRTLFNCHNILKHQSLRLLRFEFVFQYNKLSLKCECVQNK